MKTIKVIMILFLIVFCISCFNHQIKHQKGDITILRFVNNLNDTIYCLAEWGVTEIGYQDCYYGWVYSEDFSKYCYKTHKEAIDTLIKIEAKIKYKNDLKYKEDKSYGN